MRFVVDCSVSVAWYVEDESNFYTERALSRLMKEGAVVPHLWLTEFVNAILVVERKRRVTAARRRAILGQAARLPVVVDQNHARLDSLGELASAQGLTAYDATYLDLADRLRLPLATQDKDLRRAAARAGVALI